MKVYCCQIDIAWENKAANHDKVRRLLADERPAHGSLVALPEMFATGFSLDVPAISETTTRESEKFLSAAAKKFGIFLLAGVVNSMPDGRGRNEAVVFSPDGTELARYAKMQPFALGGELQRFAPGPRPITFAWRDCQVAPFICYDLRFPEVFRPVAWLEPQLIVVIANWPDTRLHHWVRLLQARAIENQAYVVGVNRCGRDPRYVYSGGRSLILDPHGEILADAGGSEGFISAELDLAKLAEYRAAFPALKDLRADLVKPPQKSAMS